MYLLDVNILVATHRDDHSHHEVVRAWFDDLLVRGDSFTVPDVVWASFVRISTNRRIFTTPTPVADAFEFMWSVCAQPAHFRHSPGERCLELFEQLCVEGRAAGDLAPDAFIAALALEIGCTVVSLDRDFGRFDRVSSFDPTRVGAGEAEPQ